MRLSSACCSLFASGVSENEKKTEVAWSLAWDDRFNGADGLGVDASRWTTETGGLAWGNNELETYTGSTQNAVINRGELVMRGGR